MRSQKTWRTSEIQGHGRRFWFSTLRGMYEFVLDRGRSDHRMDWDWTSQSVWVAFAKKES